MLNSNSMAHVFPTKKTVINESEYVKQKLQLHRDGHITSLSKGELGTWTLLYRYSISCASRNTI